MLYIKPVTILNGASLSTPTEPGARPALTITGATTATPIVVTTSTNHDLPTGAVVTVAAVGGMPEAAGDWTIVAITATTFSLTGSVGAGTYTSGGTVTLKAWPGPVMPPTVVPVGIIMPAGWTAASLTFQVAPNGVYANLYATAGEVAVASGGAVAAAYAALVSDQFLGARAIRVRSGASGSAVNQGAQRLLAVVFRDMPY